MKRNEKERHVKTTREYFKTSFKLLEIFVNAAVQTLKQVGEHIPEDETQAVDFLYALNR